MLVGALNHINVFLIRRSEGAAFYIGPFYSAYLKWHKLFSNPVVAAADLAGVAIAFWWVARRQREKPDQPAALVVFGMALGNLLGLLSLLFVPM